MHTYYFLLSWYFVINCFSWKQCLTLWSQIYRVIGFFGKTLLHISFKHDILLYFWKKWSILQFHECDSNLVCFLSYILLDLNLCFYDHVFKLNLSQKKIMGPESWVVSKMLWIMSFGFGSCVLLVGLRYEIWQLYVQC